MVNTSEAREFYIHKALIWRQFRRVPDEEGAVHNRCWSFWCCRKRLMQYDCSETNQAPCQFGIMQKGMAVGDSMSISIYIARLGSAEQLLCSVASSVPAFSAAHDTVPPHTRTFGIIHFLCTHHEHQTSTYVNHYEQTHCTYYWHCKALCLIALSAANIVQHWWQLNEIWLWSFVGMILTWENLCRAFS
jgi:hypothetical protein